MIGAGILICFNMSVISPWGTDPKTFLRSMKVLVVVLGIFEDGVHCENVFHHPIYPSKEAFLNAGINDLVR